MGNTEGQGEEGIFIVLCMFVFSKFHSEFKQKEYSVQLSFGRVCRLASRKEAQGYAEQGVEPGTCWRPG